jgi:hypothetical protein
MTNAFNKITSTALLIATALTGVQPANAATPLTHNYRAYEVVMECHNDRIQNTGSKDALRVTFVTTSGKTYAGQKIMQPAKTCAKGNKIVYRSPQIALPSNDRIAKVTVAATGQDALWARVAYVEQYDKGAPNTGFNHIRPGRWENGGGRGYCLSTDRGDSRDTWGPVVWSGGWHRTTQ